MVESDPLADREKARIVLNELDDGPKDKYGLAEELGVTPSTAKDKIQTLRSVGYDVKWSRDEGVYYLGNEPDVTRTADQISHDKVAEYLQDGIKLQELCNKLTTEANELLEVFDTLESEGLQIETKGGGDEAFYYIPGDIDRRFAIDDGDGHYRFAVISDTHLGSKAEHLQELEEFYNHCVEKGINRVFHCGDISDGWKVHPGHLNEIKDEAAGWGPLKDYVIENYPQRESITTYFIEGNHDNKFYNRNNIRLGRIIADNRDDLKYCGNCQATFVLDKTNNVDMELIHPSGGKPYTTGYRLQTLFRERSVDERPDIAFVGHLHGSMYADVEGVKGFYAGAWKGTTTYGKRKGHEAKIGGWIIDLDIEDGEIKQLVPQWQNFEERATGNRYDVEDIE